METIGIVDPRLISPPLQRDGGGSQRQGPAKKEVNLIGAYLEDLCLLSSQRTGVVRGCCFWLFRPLHTRGLDVQP